MKILFNKDNNGQAEIKAVLPFINGDYTYSNLQVDIELNTPDLQTLVSTEVYNVITEYYHDGEANGLNPADLDQVLKYMQTYIAAMAYLDFAPNNDLTHSNTGRKNDTQENEKLAWDWQINNDNAAIKKRAYKALDVIFQKLNQLQWSVWTQSQPYKDAQNLYVRNTTQFDTIFPINKSGQLYYRLVPFMADVESENILPIIGESKNAELKTATSPTTEQLRLLKKIEKAIVYKVLAKSYKTFPVEMFAEGLLYAENTRMKAQSRAEVMEYLVDEANKYQKQLEDEYHLQNQTFEANETMPGIDGGKYVNV
ncbi:hypothetical protein EZY14_002690 [Kordia sp. TARA_039_SRF]|nr:hypothetical protein EZY14_002690 [Kordia sp. TARA_039_SRF]